MQIPLRRFPLTGILAASLAGCAVTPAVQYHFPAGDSGYRIVIPRTVVKVSLAPGAAADAPGAPAGRAGAKEVNSSSKLSLTPVPVAFDPSGKPLPIYSVTDDTSGLSLVSTSVTNVKFADYLIIQSIGTQVTDNRKEAIAAVVSLVGVAGVKSLVGCPESEPYRPLNDFLIKDLGAVSGSAIPAPGNACWGYKITDIKEVDANAKYPIPSDGSSALPTDRKTSWFPYPACKLVTLWVFPCSGTEKAGTCREPTAPSTGFTGVVAVADGQAYRRMPLPQKGKVEMHSDFCVADASSEASPLSTDWALMSEAIKDVKGLNQKPATTPK